MVLLRLAVDVWSVCSFPLERGILRGPSRAGHLMVGSGGTAPHSGSAVPAGRCPGNRPWLSPSLGQHAVLETLFREQSRRRRGLKGRGLVFERFPCSLSFLYLLWKDWKIPHLSTPTSRRLPEPKIQRCPTVSKQVQRSDGRRPLRPPRTPFVGALQTARAIRETTAVEKMPHAASFKFSFFLKKQKQNQPRYFFFLNSNSGQGIKLKIWILEGRAAAHRFESDTRSWEDECHYETWRRETVPRYELVPCTPSR